MASSTYLHLVDVGGMVPAATADGGSFTAAVRNGLLFQLKPHIADPVCVVVTATTLKLKTQQRC